jgi:hypothetical protein
MWRVSVPVALLGSTPRAARLRIHAALLTWATVLLLGATLLT